MVDSQLDIYNGGSYWLQVRSQVILGFEREEELCACGVLSPNIAHILFECSSIDRAAMAAAVFDIPNTDTHQKMLYWCDMARSTERRGAFGKWARNMVTEWKAVCTNMVPPPTKTAEGDESVIFVEEIQGGVENEVNDNEEGDEPIPPEERGGLWPTRLLLRSSVPPFWDRWGQQSRAGSDVMVGWGDICSQLHQPTHTALAVDQNLPSYTEGPNLIRNVQVRRRVRVPEDRQFRSPW